MYALEIKDLNKNFESFNLQNINLKLPKGYILGYIADECYFPGCFTVKDVMNSLRNFYI